MSVEICIASACGWLGTAIVLTVSLPPVIHPALWQTPPTPRPRRVAAPDALPPPSFAAAFPASTSFRRLRRPYNIARTVVYSMAPSRIIQRRLCPTHDVCLLSSRILLRSQDGYELRHTEHCHCCKSSAPRRRYRRQKPVASFGDARGLSFLVA